jgi:N-acetylmuramoyl-L-alanine amidase
LENDYALGGSKLDKSLLKKAAVQSVALMLGVIILSYAMKEYNGVSILASNLDEIPLDILTSDEEERDYIIAPITVSEDAEDVEDIDIMIPDDTHNIFAVAANDINNEIVQQLGDQYLILKKPQGTNVNIQLEDHYITKNLNLIITGLLEEIPDDSFVGRVKDDEIYVGKPNYIEIETVVQEDDGTSVPIITRDYGNDPVHEITITDHTENTGHGACEIMLLLDHVYVHFLYEDDNFYYIDLKRPREVYDKILVIDAGHGGKDPGAVTKDGRIYEKNINIDILNELKSYLDKDNIKVYYTRIADERIFLRPRVALANDVDCDFFISIHSNVNAKSSKVNGTEILYYNHVNRNIITKDMARIFSDEIAKTSKLKQRGLVEMRNDDVLILHNALVPSILIEAGYMSNVNDLKYLTSKAGQEAIAKGIYNGILRAYEELMPDD